MQPARLTVARMAPTKTFQPQIHPQIQRKNHKIVGKLGKSIGLEWGGDWEFVDEPHFQLRPDWARKLPNNELVLAALRERVSQNRSLFS